MNDTSSSDSSPSRGGLLPALAVCVLLTLAVIWVFGQTTHFAFVNLDDDVCIYRNPWVVRGITSQGVAWAFTNRLVGNWDPVTWISHMADWQLYGSDAGGHHLTNVLLHAASVLIVFLLLWRMTGRLWPSALAAALFAIHPLRAESVAWVTERKDVLSGFFFALTLFEYTNYVKRRHWAGRGISYLAMLVFFALGLLSKPMLVTLPCVLLMLDYWPLGRLETPWNARNVARLVAEKLPLFAMVAAHCLVTFWAQRVPTYPYRGLSWRIGNALLSYVEYLRQFFCPTGLAILYPRREAVLPLCQVVAAGLVVLGISAAVFALRRKCPYLLVGWLWYLTMLLPVVGFVPFGNEAPADRFTYLPEIGLGIAIAWTMADWCRLHSYRRWACSIGSVLALAVLMGCARQQTSYWRDNETLWLRTLACTSNNYAAHTMLGSDYAARNKIDKAEEQFKAAIEIKPDYSDALFSLGVAAAGRGQMNEAMDYYRKAIEANPNYAEAHNNFGYALLTGNEPFQALKHFKEALRINADFPEAHYNSGLALYALGHFNRAIAAYQEAIRIRPLYAEAYYNLGLALGAAGQPAESRYNNGRALHILGQLPTAISEYEKALQLKPNFAEAHYNLGLALEASGQREKAIAHYRKAMEINPDFAEARGSLNALLSAKQK
jgi:protein O-mannosyl-transferase